MRRLGYDTDMTDTSPKNVNKQLAAMFRDVGAVYVALGVDVFRQRAYENAASSIEQATTSLKTLHQEGRLDEVPALGDKFIAYIQEYFDTGRIKHFERETAKVPAGFFSLLPVIGIGPKTAFQLASTYELDDPKSALVTILHLAEAGKLDGLDGIKEGKQAAIRTAIEAHLAQHSGGTETQEQRERLPYSRAVEIAHDVITYLQNCEAVIEVEPLGSLRRQAESIGDIDLAVKTTAPEAVMQYVREYPRVQRVLVSGTQSTAFWHADGVQVDVKTGAPESWGNMLQHFTGSKNHNIALRKRAIEQGKSVSEHGIALPDGSVAKHTTEAALYAELGLQFIPPEERTGGDELQRYEL